MLVVLSIGMCNHPDIRYCRVPDCAFHPAEQTGSDTWGQWYCHVCNEPISEALAIERGACIGETKSMDDLAKYGMGIMEMLSPWQTYDDAMRDWHMHKPRYPGPPAHERWRTRISRQTRDAWQVLRGRAVAVYR